MIDIIIPAYKAQSTIDKLLSSINTQLNLNEIKVTIVNDGDINDYAKYIAKYPNINAVELRYADNKGPGYARQYGIEHTKAPYIMFCDADDMLYDCISVYNLYVPFTQDKKINCVWSNILTLNNNLANDIPDERLGIWLHGKMYKRSFLKKHKITFFPNSAGEDVGFNKQVAINGVHPNNMVKIPVRTYVWTDYNKTNRLNTVKFAMFDSKHGLIDNMLYVLNNAVSNRISAERIKEEILNFILDLYVHYNLYLTHQKQLNITDEEIGSFIKWCIPVYKLVVKETLNMPKINGMIFDKTKVMYTDNYKFTGTACTFEQFMERINESIKLEG